MAVKTRMPLAFVKNESHWQCYVVPIKNKILRQTPCMLVKAASKRHATALVNEMLIGTLATPIKSRIKPLMSL